MGKGSEVRYEKEMFCKRLFDFINAEFPDEKVKSIEYNMDDGEEYVLIRYSFTAKKINVTFEPHLAIVTSVYNAIYRNEGFEWVRGEL